MLGLEEKPVLDQKVTASTGVQNIKVGPESFAKAPTKALELQFYFLSNNTTTGFTVANVLTQAGSVLTLDTGLGIGQVIKIDQMADLFYLLWQYNRRAPPNFGGNTNDYVCGVTFRIPFGREFVAGEGLPATNMNLLWTLPADAVEIDGAMIRIVQVIEHGAKYNWCLAYDTRDGPTPSTSLRQDFKFPINDLNQRTLIDLIYQTTGARTTSATTTIENFHYMKNEKSLAGILDIEAKLFRFKPPKEDVCILPTEGIPANYIPFDWRFLIGEPWIPRARGIGKEGCYGINFIGGDTNAIRDIQLAYIPV